ncbi:hypothetical protein F4860DRAFT_265890 [Xylaria cubensis]|nr:hypothetical protein F4860DRAFT_265890 [Xylaria cubensis]
MADHPRRGRNRPDSRAMWDESDRRGGARDRRDNRDRYRDERPRSRDRRQRTRSRSPVNERNDRRERHRSRSRDRRDRGERDYDRDRDRRRGYESTRDKVDGRQHDRERNPDREREREKDGRRRDEGREETIIPRGPARRGDPRRSISPQRSPLGRPGRATHNTHSPLPTRSKTGDRDSGHSSVRGDIDDNDTNLKSKQGKKKSAVGSPRDDERRGRPNHEDDSEADAMDEDDNPAAEEDDEMSAMQAMMGFGGFGSTKGQKVAGNNAGAVYKAKKTEYRQYMNRVGGFNRPLSPGR